MQSAKFLEYNPRMPKVSVLMPCYNAAATLEEALDSLAAQHLQDYELVAVEDGSQDNTPEILEKHARRDSRLRVIKQSHSGIVPALNRGLQTCESDFVARMDADDRSLPDRLAKQAAYLVAFPAIAVAGCLVRAHPASTMGRGMQAYLDWTNSLVEDEAIRRSIFIESPLPHPSVMYRRQAIQRAGGYRDCTWAEDYDLWLRLYLRGEPFGKVPEVLLEWREHPGRLTHTDPRYKLEQFMRAKATYLSAGPLRERDGLFVWGAGMMGRRISRYLLKDQPPLAAFIDVDPRKIGRQRRGVRVYAPDELPAMWRRYTRPALLAAVGVRGARDLIRSRLASIGMEEGIDWWSVA
jgi:glycosyltransferase involved in cell wall biosynthesis